MINRIERRDYDIETLRNTYLRSFYDDGKQKELNSESMQTLGLNMYIRKNGLKNMLYNAFCKSKYDRNIVMHPQQVECLNYLLKGDNLLISAPTSFGKTFVALEYMSRRNFDNIVFVVPTLALMNELFVKIKRKFGESYNIIQNGYENVEEKNIYIIVPERADIQMLSKISCIDFLVFDEIYKLQRTSSKKNEDKRIISLNKGYFELVKRSKQTLLLGPFIKDISFERTQLTENITKYITDFAPVYTQIEFRNDKEDFVMDELERENSKLVYFNAPSSIYEFASKVSKELDFDEEENSLTQWCDRYISNDWLPSEMLKKGIGIHHGKLPGFMRRYIENLYNGEEINTIFCTSTLLEGINTPTCELLVYDSSDLNAFRLNNLIGRVGRLNCFKKGHVYLFDEKLKDFLQDESKYEEISIVAENADIVDIEEVIYLGKADDELDEEKQKIFRELEEDLNKYDKRISDLQNTDGFVVEEFLRLLKEIDNIFSIVKEFQEAEDKEKTKVRSQIYDKLMKIIKYPRSYMLNQINDTIPKKKIKGAVCVGRLLKRKPASIYDRIKQEIELHVDDMSTSTLNLFIDYLFDLAFSYIKYDLSRIVIYMDFLFDNEYMKRHDEVSHYFSILEQEILSRLRIYNCDNNLLLKILIDLDFPYKDAKELAKMLMKELSDNTISTSHVLDKMAEGYEDIMNNSKIDNVTKDLIKVLLRK